MKDTKADGSSDTSHRKLKRGELKQALIDLVLQVTFEGQLSSYTMRDFARDLGVSPGAAYRHFETREELIEEAVIYMHRRSERLYEQHLPMDLSQKSVTEIVQSLCKANFELVQFAARCNELWMTLHWSSATSQAIFMKNYLPEEDTVTYRVRATRNAFDELFDRGAIERQLEPEDYLQLYLTIGGMAGKLASGKMEDSFTTYGLSKYLRSGLGVSENMDRKSTRKMVDAVLMNLFRSLGYEQQKWSSQEAS